MPDTAALPTLLKALSPEVTNGSCMARQWEALQALHPRWTLAQYLAALCEQALAHRHTQRLQRYLKESGLPTGKTLGQFDFKACPSVTSARIAQLAHDPDWGERAENLLLFGPSGVGKLATAIGYGLIEHGRRVYFAATTDLVQQLPIAKRELRLPDALGKLDKYGVLILDDIGYVKRSELESSVLFELIAHRYESGSLVITSHQPFSAWDSVFPDAIMTVAAIDRLVHHAQIIELQGESYRKAQSLRRRTA